jgi:integrase
MATRRNNGIYYFNRTLRPVGKIQRSLRTTRKRRATTLEDMLVSIHAQGRIELIRAWANGRLDIEKLAEYYESGRLPELAADLRFSDVPLDKGIEAAIRAKSPDVRATTLNRYETGLAKFKTFAGEDISVRDALDTDMVQGFKAHLLRLGAARETVNNDLQAVSVLATYAVERGWIDARPKMKRFKPQVKIRYLEAEQVKPYMAALRSPFRTQQGLLIGSGMRLGETEGLRVCDLRFDADGTRALLVDAKTPEGMRPVFVPTWTSEALKAHIEEHGLSGTDPLFTIPRRTVQKEHGRACKIAGIHDYTIHDHRHSAAVHLAKSGLPLNLLQKQLGHKHIEMTMRYATFHPDYNDVSSYFQAMGRTFGVVYEEPADPVATAAEALGLDADGLAEVIQATGYRLGYTQNPEGKAAAA